MEDNEPSRKPENTGSTALIFGALVGGGILLQALLAFHREGWGAMIQLGSHSHFHRYPWWIQAPFGLVFMGICLWALVAPSREK